MMTAKIPEVWQNWVAASDFDPCARCRIQHFLLSSGCEVHAGFWLPSGSISRLLYP
jgi:hypothetical protein